MDTTEQPYVEIVFDCMPTSLVGRVDVPLDASPRFQRRLERLKRGIEAHGTEGTYFLYNARCVFRLANSDVDGLVRFEFEGLAQTDAGDRKTRLVDIEWALVSSTCGDVPEPVLAWLGERVQAAVAIEFDRYIAAGQLDDSGDNPAPGLAEFGGSGL